MILEEQFMVGIKSKLILLSLLILFYSCKKDESFTSDKPEPAEIPYDARRAVGESANDILSDAKFNFLQVELQYVSGFAPTQAAITNLHQFLSERLNKPKGIQFVHSPLSSPNKSTYSALEIDAIEKSNRKVYTRGDTLAIYFFFADGGYSEDTNNSKVLGIAYRNTSMALFQKTIHDLSGGFGQPERSKLETVVLNHEFGHIMGLVNVGTSMQVHHQDEAHGKHCNNSKCLMHYSVETGNVVTNLLGGSMPQLDSNCIDDLRANGGK